MRWWLRDGTKTTFSPEVPGKFYYTDSCDYSDNNPCHGRISLGLNSLCVILFLVQATGTDHCNH